jgi:hypothetical protein
LTGNRCNFFWKISAKLIAFFAQTTASFPNIWP